MLASEVKVLRIRGASNWRRTTASPWISTERCGTDRKVGARIVLVPSLRLSLTEQRGYRLTTTIKLGKFAGSCVPTATEPLGWCRTTLIDSKDWHSILSGARMGRPRTKTRDVSRKHRIKHVYGLTVEQFENLWNAQDRKCANRYCPITTASPSELCVDHDHRTGKVRGLLCRRCNSAIGFMHDEVDRIRGLISFLRNPPGHLCS